MANNRVEAVERALTVLEAFDTATDSFSLADLARHTGFYKSTLLRLLGSLARFDYVRRTEDGTWQLGDTPGRLARRYAGGQGLLARAEPYLEQLAAELEETAALLERTPEGVKCLLAALPSQALRHNLQAGTGWAFATPDDPRPSIAGGEMLTVALSGPPPLRWLAVSGPAERIPKARALALLQKAAAALGEQEADGGAPSSA